MARFSNIELNGRPIPEGYRLETHAAPQGSVRCFLSHPLEMVEELDPATNWITQGGVLVWGTFPRGTARPWVFGGGVVPTQSALHPMSEPIPPPAPLPRPDPMHTTRKLIGYRGWTLDGYKLGSANRAQHGGYWNIGPNHAECRIEARRAFLAGDYNAATLPPTAVHGAPHPDCECGLYAYFSVRREDNPHRLTPDVWGAVAAWGKVEVHRSGFRAEWAEPVALGYDPRDPYEDVIRVQAIAGELDLPFVPFAELETEALKHGQAAPEEMRPPAQESKVQESLSSLSKRILEMAMGPISLGGAEMEHFVFGVEPTEPSPCAPVIEKPARRPPKGPRAILKTTGPPYTGKWRRDDMVRDRKGNHWICTRGGRPGVWEAA